MVAVPRETESPSQAKQVDAFPYGWRYVERTLPDGSTDFEQVPLTLEDVLHPQEGDQIMHSDLHQQICNYLYDVFRGQLTTTPSAVVLHDVRVAWDSPDIKPHGPDLAVVFGVRERKNWSTFDVAEEGVRPTLIVEVTSPETRSLDLISKLDEYELVRVPLYVIVDLPRRKGQIVPRLLGYRQTPSAYEVMAPDKHGRLWIEPLRVWLAIADQSVVCYDEAGKALGDYVELQAALAAETEARAAAEQARVAAEQARAAAEQARALETAARAVEAEARAAAEQRTRELEAEISRLRGEA